MLLRCDTSAADKYTSPAQKSRILSEIWFQSNAYCLSCDNDRLLAVAPNTRATDFICQVCNQNYELKSFRIKPSRTLVDGAYGALMTRILDGSVPTLMMLERSESWEIRSLTAIHHLFLTPDVIARRKALSASARRAGWIGCNILLDRIAEDAQIEVVKEGHPNEPTKVREQFRRFNGLKSIGPESRGWVTLTLRIIRDLRRKSFSLASLYEREGYLSSIYPNNKHIRAKVRQQLQVLRDLGYVEFSGRGSYRLLI
jgi:type II restriction enzyme